MLLSTRLARLFEGYALEYADRVLNHEMATRSDGYIGEALDGLPVMQTLPRDDAYRFMSSESLREVFGFEQEIVIARKSIEVAWDALDGEDTMSEEVSQVKGSGKRALNIAKLIRTKGGFLSGLYSLKTVISPSIYLSSIKQKTRS